MTNIKNFLKKATALSKKKFLTSKALRLPVQIHCLW